MKCLVIILDSCQPAYLGCYGNDWLATPTLDQLAAQAVVFDQHFAAEATTQAARWNWLTGRWAAATPPSPPFKGGARGGSLHRLPELLWDHGVRTVLIGDERSPSLHRFGATGWEEQHWIRRERLPELEQESLLGGTIQTAIEWLTANQGLENWLLWLELGSLRPPWDSNEFDAEALEGHDEASLQPRFDPAAGSITRIEADRAAATYAGVVSGVDQWLGMLVSALKEHGLHDELLLLLTSDHGLPLGEHGLLGCEPPLLHEELVHVPLLIKLPSNQEAGRRVHQLTQSIELLPTLLEAFAVAAPDSVHGRSLLGVARGEPTQRRDYVCSRSRRRGQSEWSLRTHGWYLRLLDKGMQLFIKPEDRWEANDVASQHPEVAEHLELTLRRFQAALAADRLDQAPELRDDMLEQKPGRAP